MFWRNLLHFSIITSFKWLSTPNSSKIEICAIPQNKNENFYSMLSNKKKFDRKDLETKKRRSFEIRAKIGKNLIFRTRGPPTVKWSIFDDFWRFCPDFKMLPFARLWAFPINFFFVWKHRIKNFISILRNRAYLIFGIVRTHLVTTLIFRLKLPFFLDLPSLQPNAIFLFFDIFTKMFKKLVKDDLSFRLKKNWVQTDHYWRSYRIS